jgi:hypothetical protein
MYKLHEQTGVMVNTSFIPFDLANNDYVRFKKEIENNEAELQDADGNTMTADDAKAYIATLP